MARKEAVDRAEAELVAALGQSTAQLLDGLVRLVLQQPQNKRRLRLNPPRAAVAAQSTRSCMALLTRQSTPAAHARSTHPKALARLSMTGTRSHHPQHPLPQI